MNELDFGNDDETIILENKKVNSKTNISKIEEESKSKTNVVTKSVKITKRPIINYLFCDPNSYTFGNWKDVFPDNKIKLRNLVFNSRWNNFFDIVEKKSYFSNMEKILSGYLSKNTCPIYPLPELVFNSLNVIAPDRIKVVIIGQDPYINYENINGKDIPQAMGCSFSVPYNYPKPPSLTNIYQNLEDFGHVKKKPDGGCLAGWIMQGCLMLNASMTVFYKQSNSHKSVWQEFTKDLIKYINEKCDKVVFLAWGKDAHTLCLNVDPHKHCIITSSHPSPYAYTNSYTGFQYGLDIVNRKSTTYPPFKSTDHFGRANEYLKNNGKKEIYWDLIDINWDEYI